MRIIAWIIILGFLRSHVSVVFLQTAQIWANAGVCSASCTHALGSMFVCLFVWGFFCFLFLQAILVIGCREGKVHDCCLKTYGVFYFSKVWWDHIPDATWPGVKGEHLVAPGFLMAEFLYWQTDFLQLFCRFDWQKFCLGTTFNGCKTLREDFVAKLLHSNKAHCLCVWCPA